MLIQLNHNLKRVKKPAILYLSMILNLLLGFIVTKINTTLLSVAEYGMFSLCINTIVFTHVFFSCGLFEASSRLIAVEQYKQKTKEISGTTIILTVILGIFFNLAILCLSQFFDSIFKIRINFLLFLFFPFVFAILFQSMFQIILRGLGHIGKLSVFTFLPRLFYVISMLLLSMLGVFTLKNSIYAYLLNILIVVIAFIFILKPSFKHIKYHFNKLISEVKNFGSYLYIANILSAFFYHIDKFIIAYFLDVQQLAFYSLGFALTYPLSQFSSALSISSYKKFANQNYITKKYLYVNLIFVLLPALLLIIFRKFIVLDIFSKQFLPTIDIVTLLTVASVFKSLSIPYTMFFKAQKRGREVRNITIIVQIVFFILNLILIPAMGIIGASITAVISYGLDYILYFFKYRSLFLKNI